MNSANQKNLLTKYTNFDTYARNEKHTEKTNSSVISRKTGDAKIV